MKIKPLEFILSIETVICVYRKFHSYKKIIRLLIGLRIFLEIFLAAVNVGIRQYYQFYDQNVELFYFYLSTANSAVLLPIVCINSSTFQKLVKCIEIQHKYFGQNTKYSVQLDIGQKLFTGVIITFCMVKLCLFMYVWIQYDLGMPYVNVFFFYILQLVVFTADIRYIFEFVVIYYILCVLAQQLASITKSIDQDISDIIKDANYIKLVKKSTVSTKYKMKLLDKWSTAYENIKQSSDIFNAVFSFQLSIMFLSTFFYYILLLYAITLSVSGFMDPSKKFLCVCTLLIYLIVIYMLSLAAQRAENNYVTLKRRLCTLSLHYISVPEYREATRNLLRVVSTRPIRIESYGDIVVDMSLLPRYIAMCTSYTIVALQFNEII